MNSNQTTFLAATLTAAAMLTFVSTASFAGEVKATSGAFRTPVVELYTSEGCSSCPRADDWVAKLGDSLDDEFHAVPLAFHVDYWNRLGWEDPFSDPAFTERQQDLAAINKQRSIYTPEFLVSGEETRGTTSVVEAIRKANADLASVSITMGLMPGENGLDAELVVNNQSDRADLYLAVYESNIVREIAAGENKGLTLHHDFVVRHWQKVATVDTGEYQGKHMVSLDEDWNRDNLGFAAIMLDRDTGKTLQALKINVAEVFAGES